MLWLSWLARFVPYLGVITPFLSKYKAAALGIVGVVLLVSSFFMGMRVEHWRNDSVEVREVRVRDEAREKELERQAAIAWEYANEAAARETDARAITRRIIDAIKDPALLECPPAPADVVRDLNTLRGHAAPGGPSDSVSATSVHRRSADVPEGH